MIRIIQRLCWSLILFVFSISAYAQFQVQDDTGQVIHLKQPAKRIISLSPGLTELVYAAGGSDYIKGVVSFSDFPEQAKKISQVGRYNSLDLEKILSLQPALVVAWKSGNPQHQIQHLKDLGLTVYVSEPREFTDIPKTILKLGHLMSTETVARKNAQDFTEQFEQLKQRYQLDSNKEMISTFIQIWNNPVMSVNQHHLISKVVSLCGGQNIFADTKGLTSTPSIEAILQKNPELIIATGMADTSKDWLNRWQQWPFLNAVKHQQLYAVNPDYLVRHTPRILLGIKEVCQIINPEPED